MYTFAPLLEETGILILGASYLWHPWSRKRIAELKNISASLIETARDLREKGLSWASNTSGFGDSSGYILRASTPHRYHANEDRVPNPEATPYMVAAALKILFFLLSEFEKVENTHYEERGGVERISKIIETLMEAPYHNPSLEISDDVLKLLGLHGILMECESLAHTQGTIENRFNRDNKTAKKKKSNLTDAELKKLAIELNIPFDALKEIFETECSSWRHEAQEYQEKADVQKEIFLSHLSEDAQILESVRAAWDPGDLMSDGGDERFWRDGELQKSEFIIKTFISALLFHTTKRELESALPKLAENKKTE